MPYPEGTWVVDTRTGDLGEVMRRTPGLLSLSRLGNRGLWAAEPCSVRRARPSEVASAEAASGVWEGRVGSPGGGTQGEPFTRTYEHARALGKLAPEKIAQKGKLQMEPTTMDTTALTLPDGPRKGGTALPVTGAPQAREWRITTTSRHTVSGYLPPWATEDPSEVDVPIEHLAARLVDVHHYADFEGQIVRNARRTGHDGAEPADLHVLCGSIDCVPFAADPDPRVPTVNVNLTPECWLSDLGPDDVLRLVAQLRSQADRLAYEVHPALVAARADWAAAHGDGADAVAVHLAGSRG